MRCQMCNCLLTDKEAVKKDEFGNYPDICINCDLDLLNGDDESWELNDELDSD